MAKPVTRPDEHRIKLFTARRLGEARHLAALLDALEAHGLGPTHAGVDLRAKGAFDRAAVIAAVTSGAQPITALLRRKAPTATVIARAQPAGLTSIAIELPGALKDPELPYRLGDALAAAFAVEHGVVHPSYPGEGDFNMAGAVELGNLQSYGPLPPAARTWYGAHIAGLLGPALAKAGGAQEQTAWGATRVDLVPAPWSADFAALAKRQREAEQALAKADVLGDYSHPVRYKRGARWQPIPAPGAEGP